MELMDMTPEQATEAAKGMTFEKVWLYMQETQKQFRENQKQFKEIQQEFRVMQQEISSQTAKVQQEISNLSKNVGGLNNSIGKITEAMFAPEISEKFNKLGYNFSLSTTSRNKEFTENKQIIAEADIFLENGSVAIIIEIKTEITTTHIDEHIERINIIKEHMNKRNDNRSLLGAVAGTIINNDTIKYAQKNGLFVLVQSGESVKIVDIPEGFKPGIW
jgi:hypothetical protein